MLFRSWAAEVLNASERFHAFVVGPGMGRMDVTARQVRELLLATTRPVVVDGDGLFALAWSAQGASALLRGRSLPTVITPHDGEYQTLVGRPSGPDRIAAARSLAADTGAVVLLKGATTVVAGPDGRVLVITNGDQRLATAGTGDVLAGIIGALLARGVPAVEAAAAGAWLHGDALRRLPQSGVVASDLVDRMQAMPEEFVR